MSTHCLPRRGTTLTPRLFVVLISRGHFAFYAGHLLTQTLGYSKYQFMELNLQRRVAGLKDKMPDIQKTLETVKFLKTRTVG